MGLITVPKGKRVQFHGIEALYGDKFLLEEDLTVRVTSNFSPLVDSSVNNFFTLGAGVVKGLTGLQVPTSLKQFGYQQWNGTEPIGFTFTIGIYMETDALNDVVRPAQTLLGLTVPTIINGTLNSGLAAPGPSLYDVVFNNKNGNTGVGVDVGPCTFNQCIIRSAEPTISQEVDSEGYPIWIKLRLDMATVFTANTSMIEEMFAGFGNALNNNDFQQNKRATQSISNNYGRTTNTADIDATNSIAN